MVVGGVERRWREEEEKMEGRRWEEVEGGGEGLRKRRIRGDE